MNDCIETKEIVVLVQENGIIRNKKGRFLARLDDEIEFDGEHLVEEKMYSREDVENLMMQSYIYGQSDKTISFHKRESTIKKLIKEN